MTISIEELNHGGALRNLLLSLTDLPTTISYKLIPGEASRSAYELLFIGQDATELFRVGLFIKICAARRSPWRFSFTYLHQLELDVMKDRCANVFLVMVASNDGYACVDYAQLKQLLDDHFEEVEWISLSRKLNESYRVAGKDGKLDKPLARNSFPTGIRNYVMDELSKFL